MLKKLIIIFTIPFLYCNQAFSWPIPDSGQTKCYDYSEDEIPYSKEIPCPIPGKDFYGQDGNYIINPPSYTKLDENGNSLPDDASSWVMVKDNVTGLIWENKTDDGSIHDKDKKYSWQGAQDFFINILNENAFGGATDWRLPTIDELASSTNLNTYSPAIDENWFSNIMPEFYWSSTSNAFFDDHALGIHFKDGNDNNVDKNLSYYVRAVRGGQSRPHDHLVLNNDGTITDTATGLMWQTKSYTTTWKEALAYCNELELADFSDWRMPSREALRSIVDYSKYDESIFDKFNKVSGFYWSSTSVASDTDLAWGIRFNGGYDNHYCKYSTYYVRGVRGGQYWIAGHLFIEYPGQGAILTYGSKVSISWDTANIGGDVRICLSTNGGNAFSTIENQTANDGKYDWNIPEMTSVNCVLKIEPVHQPERGTSQGFFSIYPPPPLIKGRVISNAENTIISDVMVSIHGQTTQTNSDGIYSLAITQPGIYTIVFSKKDYVTKEIKQVYLKSGNNIIDVALLQPASIAGLITDVWNNAIGGVRVVIDDKTDRTDSQGKYLIENLIPGNTSISFSHPLYNSVTIDNVDIQPLTCTTINYNLSKPILLNMATLYLPDAEIDDHYEERLLADGEMPFTFTIAFGNLPPGLTLNPQTGAISGKLEDSGTYTFNIGVSDASASYAEREFTIDVIDHLSIVTQYLPRGTKNNDYLENILATGGIPPYTFTIASGALPSYLELSATGQISGQAAKSGTYQLSIQVMDRQNRIQANSFTIQIVDPLEIQTNRLNNGIINTQYNQNLSASGGYGNYIWSVCSGMLPQTFSIDNTTQQLIGEPDQSAYKSIVLSVTDSDGRTAYKNFILHIVPPLTIPMSKLPDALKNEQYSQAIPIQGGIGAFTYASMGLPPDLTIDPLTGIISGKSIIGGYNNVEIQVTDNTWPTIQNVSLKLGIRTRSMLTILTNSVLPISRQGEPVSIDSLRVSGESSAYEWSCIKGYLPAGIQLDQTNGSLSGTPIGAGTQLFTLQVTDDQDQTAEKEFVWQITETLKINTRQVPDAAENMDYIFVFEAAGGIPPYEFQLKTGELPMGIQLNKTGMLNGMPKSRQTLSFTIEVVDSDTPAQKTEKAFTIEVLKNELYIFTPDIPNAYINYPYVAIIEAKSGQPPYTWHYEGELPPGLTLQPLSDTVQLEGTPTMQGDYQFTLFVQDASIPSSEVSKVYQMTVYVDSRIDLQDIILALQIMAKMMISVDGWMDINQDCKLGLQEIIEILERIAH